jgi:hypothetical protein
MGKAIGQSNEVIALATIFQDGASARKSTDGERKLRMSDSHLKDTKR